MRWSPAASRRSPIRMSAASTSSPSSLVGGHKLSDAEFAEVDAAIGRTGIAEVLVLIGYYTSVALGMKVHQVPIPPPQG